MPEKTIVIVWSYPTEDRPTGAWETVTESEFNNDARFERHPNHRAIALQPDESPRAVFEAAVRYDEHGHLHWADDDE